MKYIFAGEHCGGCGEEVDNRDGWTYCMFDGPKCGPRCPKCGPHTHKREAEPEQVCIACKQPGSTNVYTSMCFDCEEELYG